MIDHVSIGVREISRAKRFYGAVLEPLGYKCLSESNGSPGYGRDAIALWIAAGRPVPSDDESGLHFCFRAPTRDSVDAFHTAALDAGGRDNGRPGRRTEYGPNYHAAFVVDPDGYCIEAYCGYASRTEIEPWKTCPHSGFSKPRSASAVLRGASAA